jgi:hypothetical protein
MKQECVTIGMQARVKIGQRLAEVTVLRQLEGRGRARFECRTSDTGRLVKATAARLRPVPPRAVDAMVERMMIDARLERLAAEQAAEREAAWQRGRQASVDAELAAWASQPVGAY